MGHIRIGPLMRTREWCGVVELIEQGAEAARVAAASIAAARADLSGAGRDPGVVEATFLLLRVPHAARQHNFSEGLDAFGVSAPEPPQLMDLVAGITHTADERLDSRGERSDLGEMALMAAAESLARLLTQGTAGLFGATADDVRQAARDLSTSTGLGRLGRTYVSRFAFKALDYYLSRTLALETGEGGRFVTLARVSEFSRELERHCEESAAVVTEFTADFVSLRRWRDGAIKRSTARDYAHGALNKLLDVLHPEGRSDG